MSAKWLFTVRQQAVCEEFSGDDGVANPKPGANALLTSLIGTTYSERMQ